MRALRIAATGMAAQQLNVEVISNNIANMNTVGFKKQRAEFADLLYQSIERPGNSLDLAISGQGYFQVLMPSGETAYSRAGNFSVNNTGQLVTADGYQIIPAITIPQNSQGVTISQTGQVQVSLPGQSAPQVIGQLQTATFFNEAGLEAQGNNLFLESGASGPPVIGQPGQPGFGTLMQGYTEASNVDPVSEITALIVAQRAYEMNSKVVSAADSMLAVASQIKS